MYYLLNNCPCKNIKFKNLNYEIKIFGKPHILVVIRIPINFWMVQQNDIFFCSLVGQFVCAHLYRLREWRKREREKERSVVLIFHIVVLFLRSNDKVVNLNKKTVTYHIQGKINGMRKINCSSPDR